MANELTLTGSVLDNLINQSIGVSSLNVSQSATPPRSTECKQNIGITEEALQLGELTGATLGVGIFINLDAVNFVELRVATAGTKFAKLRPGQFAILPLGSGITAPYAIADTAPVLLRFKIWEA